MNLKLMDKNNKNIINTIFFPTQMKGEVSLGILEFHLWNRKDGLSEFTATDIEANVLSYDKDDTATTNYKGQEVITDNLVECKSSGTIGTGIIDDANSVFTPIGKSNSLVLGDIPVNCARKLFFRIKTSEENLTQKAVFFVKIKYNYTREKVLANSDDDRGTRLVFPTFLGEVFI